MIKDWESLMILLVGFSILIIIVYVKFFYKAKYDSKIFIITIIYNIVYIFSCLIYNSPSLDIDVMVIFYLLLSSVVYKKKNLFITFIAIIITILYRFMVFENFKIENFFILFTICIMSFYINLKFKISIDLKNEYMDLKKTAELSDKFKSNFLANMSHEIRTPMNSIIGMAYILQNTNLDLRQKDYIEKLKISANSLLKLLNNILDFSKVESGKLVFEKKEFDLFKSMYEIANINVPLASRKGVNIYLKVKNDKKRYIIGDSLRFEQVINNILSNSVKFTESGFIVLEYIKSIEEKNKVKCYFSVEDTGIGIQEKDLNKIFSFFSQADASITRKYGGSGLGLTISKSIVEEYNGKINVFSQFKKGTKMFFNMEFDKSCKKNILNEFDLEQNKCNIYFFSENEVSKNIILEYLENYNLEFFSSYEEIFRHLKKINSNSLFIIDFCYGNNKKRYIFKDIIKVIKKQTNLIVVSLQFGDEESLNYARLNGLENIILKPFCQYKFINYLGNVINLNNGNVELKKRKSICNKFEGKSILLVDDDVTNASIIRDILINCKFLVDIVTSGEGAYNNVKNKKYDLILMDVVMPGWDGYKTSENIKKVNNYKNVPIIGLSASFKEYDNGKNDEYNFDYCLIKPFSPEKLINLIYEIFGNGDDINQDYSNKLDSSNNTEYLLMDYRIIFEKLEKMDRYLLKFQPKPCRDIFEEINKMKLPPDLECDYRKMKILIDSFDFKKARKINKTIIDKITDKINEFHKTKV